MQSAASRIWTRVAVSISYDDNYYTTGSYHDDEMMSKREIRRQMDGDNKKRVNLIFLV